MPVLVMKFGGTSVASLDKIKSAAERIASEVSAGHSVIVIVSAMAGKTNELVGWVNETSPLYDAREYDAIVLAKAGLNRLVIDLKKFHVVDLSPHVCLFLLQLRVHWGYK